MGLPQEELPLFLELKNGIIRPPVPPMDLGAAHEYRMKTGQRIYDYFEGVIDGVIDACDQVRAKLAIAAWALQTTVPLVIVGAAGGKRAAQHVEVADLAHTTHDPLLAALRQRLRKAGAPRAGAIGLRCVFSREAVALPQREADDASCAVDGSLNCAGYGSTVAVTATFGMVAAGEIMQRLSTGAWSAAAR
jgi:tRNA A37 threonylcarbamoyladenosine dehydratase